MVGAGLRFLVVEDHEFQRNMLVKILRALGAASVYAMPEGRAALQLMQDAPTAADIIISDVDMPTMDGMEFIRHVGAAGYGTSLIIASSLEHELLNSVEALAAAHGVRLLGTIQKPVTRAKLEELIARHRSEAPPPRPPPVTAPLVALEEILDGLAHDVFEPHFQPKVDMATGRVIGAEALARWRHPRHGLLMPNAFITALEDGGHIGTLMRCMLTKGAAFCRTLHEAGHDATVAVNVSVKSLTDTSLADQITQIVTSQRISPRCMVLEITESAATTEVAKVLENLARLRMKGFGLSIDDYGTGYSSMEQLTRIPFTELKIDQSFVSHAGRRESAKVILGSSLAMARKLRIRAVAEGVETQADWDLLRELECDIAQGYYIAKPMQEDVFLDWLSAR